MNRCSGARCVSETAWILTHPVLESLLQAILSQFYWMSKQSCPISSVNTHKPSWTYCASVKIFIFLILFKYLFSSVFVDIKIFILFFYYFCWISLFLHLCIKGRVLYIGDPQSSSKGSGVKHKVRSTRLKNVIPDSLYGCWGIPNYIWWTFASKKSLTVMLKIKRNNYVKWSAYITIV